MGRKLAAMGVRSCGDLLQVSLSQLQKKFGPRTGQTLFRFCRGLDDRPVRYEKERKSVSAEMNYNIRFTKVQSSSSSSSSRLPVSLPGGRPHSLVSLSPRRAGGRGRVFPHQLVDGGAEAVERRRAAGSQGHAEGHGAEGWSSSGTFEVRWTRHMR